MLKAEFHTHFNYDTDDFFIKYDIFQLIDEAKRKKFDVLGITCHDKFFYDKKAKDYAKKNDIIILFGIEKKVEGKHVLILNTNKECEKINTFSDLKQFKLKNKNLLIIAAHPYFPTNECLKNDIIRYEKLFDAFELSYFFTKKIDFNKKTLTFGKKIKKPFVANSDVHYLNDLGKSFTLIDSEKNIDNIIKAVKNGKTTPILNPLRFNEIILRILNTIWHGLMYPFVWMYRKL